MDRRRRHSLAAIAALSSAAYTTIAPILPIEFSSRYVSERWVSLIFLSFSIGSAAAPPAISRRFERHGTVEVMAWSMAGMGVSFLCLGCVFDLASLVSPIDDDNDDGGRGSNGYSAAVGTISIVIQFMMGALFSAVSTGYYSLATLVFEDKDSAISIIEAAIGVGYILGPIVGSVIYSETSYRTSYTMVALGMMALAFITWRFISPYFDNLSDVAEGDSCSEDLEVDLEARVGGDMVDYNSFDNEDGKGLAGDGGHIVKKSMNVTTRQLGKRQLGAGLELTSLSLLRHPQILISAMTITWVNMAWTCIEPLLAKRLDDHFHISTREIGIIFSLNNIVYVPVVFLTQYLPTHGNLRHWTISISTLLTPLAVLSVGSDSFPLLMVGCCSLGLIPTPVWIMLLPFMQEESTTLIPDPSVRRRLNDVTAGTYNSFMLLGQVLGYGIGGVLGSRGFALTTRIVALAIFVQGALFYLGTDRRGRTKHADRCR